MKHSQEAGPRWQRAGGVCARHGAYEAPALGRIKPACPQCVDWRMRQNEQQRQERNSRRLELDAWRQAGISPRFYEKDFAGYQTATPQQKINREQLENYCRDFAANLAKGRCLVMVGRPGTGKTHLAAAMVKTLLAANYSARMLGAYEALRLIKDTWSKNADYKEARAFAELASPQLLALDEVGAHYGTDMEKLMLFKIINQRYEQMRPTIIISNEDLNGLRAFLGERAFDRLRENGGIVLGFTWNSFRSQTV